MGENAERLDIMKKIIIFAVSAFLLLSSGIAIGSSVNEWHGFPIAKVESNGKPLITLPDDYSPPISIDGHVYVPLFMLRQAGLQVTWNSNTSTVDAKVPHQLTDTELAEISKSVGMVYALDAQGQPFKQGSGFMIKGGIFVTNYHVASGSTGLQITLNGKTYTVKDYVFKNEQKDLYGVRLDADAKGLEYTSEIPLFGTFITAIGYPEGKYSVSGGKINASLYADNFVGHGAKIGHGSSGGVLIDDKGIVEAITSGGFGDSIGGQAIPTYYLEQEIARIK